MTSHCTDAGSAERVWRTSEGIHINVRGLEPPEPMIAILQLLDSGEADAAVIAHLDREPIYLYPELIDRGWSYELVHSACGSPDCEGGVELRLVRWGR